eukprot:TRINITY_DN2690_c0_g1_i1.p1 TRINITY_DN2690_c0_g1~~TRINITY_DN2690_c0_g1_i1.p1  ORF type:complete len:350 (+),score=74.33 TRINITY_DN2690_c0_g1_i1:42-1091(+)
MNVFRGFRYYYALSEGRVIERIRQLNLSDVPLNPHVGNALLVNSKLGQEEMKKIYRSYCVDRQLPLLLLTPTWQANPHAAKAACADFEDLNTKCVTFLKSLRSEVLNEEFSQQVNEQHPEGAASPSSPPLKVPILIGGLLGPKGDAHQPRDAMCEEEAFQFHSKQANLLAKSGVDFLMASTIPSLSEAKGMARAMACTRLMSIVSFVVRRTGHLLDNTPLQRAIEECDAAYITQVLSTMDNKLKTQFGPLIKKALENSFGTMLNCTHPSVADEALKNVDAKAQARVIGLQADTNSLDAKELDNTCTSESFTKQMIQVTKKYPSIRILGGCCGTDDRIADECANALNSSA